MYYGRKKTERHGQNHQEDDGTLEDSELDHFRKQQEAPMQQQLPTQPPSAYTYMDFFANLTSLLEMQAKQAAQSWAEDREMLREILQKREDTDAAQINCRR